jgi:hemerythrin-like domain-containing protein
MSDTRLISRSPVNLLTEEHELLSSFLDAYADLSARQTGEQSELLQRIEEEVGRHIGIEESLFYPTLLELKDPRVHERVAEALTEHRVLESLVSTLRNAEPGPERRSALSTLRTTATRHMDYEELEVFPFCWGLPGITLNQLGLAIEERRTQEGFF